MSNIAIIIIIAIIAAVFYLLYTQNSKPKYYPHPDLQRVQDQRVTVVNPPYPVYSGLSDNEYLNPQTLSPPLTGHSHASGAQCENCNINKRLQKKTEMYDQIKNQDETNMYDLLSYPNARLPREVLEKYQEYYNRHGEYPPFMQGTRPLFDNPVLNGILIKEVDENEPFADNIPSTVPLFRVKSAKNTNRFYYYIIEQRYHSKLELKIPLDNVRINNVRIDNADFYGLPELYDGDVIERISIYPNAKFRVKLYKMHHFP